jgi:hypothetical protein
VKKITPDDVQHFITNDTEIIVKEMEYLTKLSQLLKDTDARIVANYILWRVTKDLNGVLDTRFDDIAQVFQHKYQDIQIVIRDIAAWRC